MGNQKERKTEKKKKPPQIPSHLNSEYHPLSILLGKIITHLSTKFIKGSQPKPILSVIVYLFFSYQESFLRNLILVILYTWHKKTNAQVPSVSSLEKMTSTIYRKETNLFIVSSVM